MPSVSRSPTSVRRCGDDAVDRRDERRVGEPLPRQVERGTGRLPPGVGLVGAGLRAVERRPRDRALLGEAALALEVAAARRAPRPRRGAGRPRRERGRASGTRSRARAAAGPCAPFRPRRPARGATRPPVRGTRSERTCGTNSPVSARLERRRRRPDAGSSARGAVSVAGPAAAAAGTAVALALAVGAGDGEATAATPLTSAGSGGGVLLFCACAEGASRRGRTPMARLARAARVARDVTAGPPSGRRT